jgi:tRNA pseudouridine38-40 synthase
MSDGVRYRATIAYVGTFFHGWQRQKNADRTVQAAVERALGRTAGAPVTVHAAGRTDTGVHADGQVAHFDLEADLAPRRLHRGANALLPWDARLLEVARAAPEFQARRDAVWKEYLYRWSRAEVIPPGEALFVAPISAHADTARMAAAAELLPGERDFGIFAVRRPEEESGVRNLHFVGLEERGDEIRALFRGDGFLRGMIRSICGVLADVGRARAPAERVAELLATGNRRLLSPKAKACGLTLVRVHYEDR